MSTPHEPDAEPKVFDTHRPKFLSSQASIQPCQQLCGARSPKRRLLIIAVYLANIALLSALAWFASGAQAEKNQAKLLERERVMALTTAETISANLGRNLGQMYSVPMVLAKDPSVISALQRFGPDVKPSPLPVDMRRSIWLSDPEFIRLIHRFEEIITQADINQIWIVNAAADCFISAGFKENLTASGANYVKRYYYQEGKKGRAASQFAVGATSSIPGLYFSSPVTVNGRFLGVVVVKLELPKLEPLLATSNSLISDENGVVILARQPDLMMKTMPGATVSRLPDSALKNRYRRTTFEAIDIRPTDKADSPDLIHWQGSELPYIMKKRDLPDEIISIYVLRPLNELAQIRHDRLWLFTLLSVIGFLMVTLAAGAAAYLRRSREAKEELTLLANTDALTRCSNRRCFLAALDNQWRSALRYNSTFSVISLDLDHFKSINDRFGHSGGDQVLCHFVDIVGRNLRSCDTLGRIGGEEFAILLPQTTATGALAVADRIMSTSKAHPVLLEMIEFSYTCSGGHCRIEH